MYANGSLSQRAFSLTSNGGGSLNVESHRNGGAGVSDTGRWNGQSRCSPRRRDETAPGCESRKRAGVGPGKVSCTQRRTSSTGVLLGQTTIRGGIFGIDEDET